MRPEWIASLTPRRMLLSLRRWVGGRPLALRLYRGMPQGLRMRFARGYAAQLAAGYRFPRLPALERAPADDTVSPTITAPENDRGVNLFAFFRGEFGLGQAARLYAKALMRSLYPVAVNDMALDVPHRFQDASLVERMGGSPDFPVDLVFVNPDYFEAAMARIRHDRGAARRRHVIACWFWELEQVPDAWRSALAQVDEVMVASSFVESAFRRITDKPVTRVPLPVHVEPDSGLSRADFGLEDDTFLFLVSFDFHSWFQRKNPLGAIEAFRLAFPDGTERARLLVKTSNGERHPDRLAELIAAAAADPRIVLRDGVMDGRHLRSLQRCCDAYVSLHRAEGFGLGMAECMAIGKPVIATGWSGNMDFMDHENSCLVDSRLVDIRAGEYLHGEGQQWADPDVAHAARHMRRLFSDPEHARSVGQRAAADISRMLAPEHAIEPLVARLDRIRADMDGHGHAPRAQRSHS